MRLQNVALERLQVETSYMDKISKAQSEMFTAQSNFYSAKEKEVNCLTLTVITVGEMI